MTILRNVSLFLTLIALGECKKDLCRWRLGNHFVDTFNFIQCYYCYVYFPPYVFPNGKQNFSVVSLAKKIIRDEKSGEIFFLDPTNKSIPMYKSFPNENLAKKWVDCCRAAEECCQKMLRDPFVFSDGKKYCPRTWDGWQCWPDTEPGTIAKSTCADHIYFTTKVSCSKPAEKVCTETGEWFKINGTEWTNYAHCGIRDIHSRIYFHLSCLGISIACLIPAIIIFLSYKSLRVHRIYIHTNLFVSLLLCSTIVIIFKSVLILNQLNSEPEESILSKNERWCKFLSMCIKYFRLTNYSWMFCEGFYLHRLIAAAFAKQKNLYIFYSLGWGFPLVPVIVYAIIRLTTADEDCWTVPTGSYEWLTNAPMLLALGLNFIFLCDINRVLIAKLRMKNNSQEPTHYRKAVRATLVLIPLFGLHSVMTIYRPPANLCELSEVYSYLSDGLDGLQGLMVAIIFCYTNNEVLSLLKRSYVRRKLKRPSSSVNSSSRTISLSVITRSSIIYNATAHFTSAKDITSP